MSDLIIIFITADCSYVSESYRGWKKVSLKLTITLINDPPQLSLQPIVNLTAVKKNFDNVYLVSTEQRESKVTYTLALARRPIRVRPCGLRWS